MRKKASCKRDYQKSSRRVILRQENLESRFLLSTVGLFQIGELNSGIGVRDGVLGSGYLMYSDESVHERFAANPPISSNDDHLIAVRHESGSWQYNDNSEWVDFTPQVNDRLLAEVDFTNDLVSSLAGEIGTIDGIETGFVESDLEFHPNVWRGTFNRGEFSITGTYFTVTSSADPNDQISEASLVPLGATTNDVISSSLDVDLKRITVPPNQTIDISISSDDPAFHPTLRLFDANGNELARSETSPEVNRTILNAGTLANVFVDSMGQGEVEIDLTSRRIESSNHFFVEASAGNAGDGTSSSPFSDLGGTIRHVNAMNYPDAVIHVANGTYSWGTIQPRFDMMLLGQGVGSTVIQGDPSSPAIRSRRPDVSLFFEGVSVLGGSSALDARNGNRLTIVDSELAFANSGDGAQIFDFSSVVVKNVSLYDNHLDGISYHNALGAPMEVLEIDVQSYDNGKNDSWTSQGSTTHNTVDIVRVGGRYFGNQTNIGDVSSGTSWNVDIETSNARHEKDYNFYLSGGGTAWFISGEYDVDGVIRIQQNANGIHSDLMDLSNQQIELRDGGSFVGPDNSQLVPFNSPRAFAEITHELPDAGEFFIGVSANGNQAYNGITGNGDIAGDSSGSYSLTVDSSLQITTVLIGSLRRGIQVPDNATGTGYLMYSAESAHGRFTNVDPNNSDHVVAVRYRNGQWEIAGVSSWQVFIPRGTDRLIASVDFDVDTVNGLLGQFGNINGIMQGYFESDLAFFADLWNGSFNNGEFSVTGSFFSFIS